MPSEPSGSQWSPTVSSGASVAQVAGLFLGEQAVGQNPDKDEVPGSSPGLRAAVTRRTGEPISSSRGHEATPRRTKDMLPQPSERQIPILPGLMQDPMPAGLTLVIELVLDSPTTRAPKPGKHSSDPAEHGRLPLLCPLPRTVLLARHKNKTAGGPGVLGEGRGRSALGPYRIGNLRIRAGTSGHDGYEGIAGRSTFLPMTSVARAAWRRVRIPPPPPCDVSGHRNDPEPTLGSGSFGLRAGGRPVGW